MPRKDVHAQVLFQSRRGGRYGTQENSENRPSNRGEPDEARDVEKRGTHDHTREEGEEVAFEEEAFFTSSEGAASRTEASYRGALC